MKKYMIYLDDGRDCFKIAVPADSVKAAKKIVAGNGEIINIKDVSDDYPISGEKVHMALKAASFGETEIDFIIRALRETDIITD